MQQLTQNAGCVGLCTNEDQVKMATLACLDGREVADTKVFRYTVVNGQESTIERITIPHGKALVVTEGQPKLAVTNDLVIVCCDFFFNELTNKRRLPEMTCTLNQVRVDWVAFPISTVREGLSRLQYTMDLMVRDFALVNQVIKLCDGATTPGWKQAS